MYKKSKYQVMTILSKFKCDCRMHRAQKTLKLKIKAAKRFFKLVINNRLHGDNRTIQYFCFWGHGRNEARWFIRFNSLGINLPYPTILQLLELHKCEYHCLA